MFKKISYFLTIGKLNKKFLIHQGVPKKKILSAPYFIDNSFFYTTILPMLLIIICTWFIYLAQTEQSRFSTTTGSIFAIIAINLTASTSLPELSYNTLYDVFFLICISSVLFTVSALIITFKISQRGYDINKMHTSLIIIHPLLVIIIGSLIITNIYPDFVNMLLQY